MKILYVSSALIPSRTANSINIMKSCHAMAALGHEVVLLAPATDSPEIVHDVGDPFEHYGISRNFTLKKLSCANLPGGRSIYCLLCSLHARLFKPDLVFGRYVRATYQVCKLGIPTVLELHGGIRFEGQKTRYLRKLLKCRELLALCTVSEEMAGHFREVCFRDLPPKPILVAGNGADPARPGIIPARLPRSTAGYQIGFPGKLQKTKGIELIGELARIATEHDFHIFGGSAEEVAFWQNRYPLNNLHFHGFIAPGALPPYLAALDICLLPCQKNPINPGQSIYGSPLKLFEYMAYGKAILTSDMGEIHEVVDRETAVFLDPEDASAWARAIDGLTREEIGRLGRAAKTRFERNFTREARYHKLLQEIQLLKDNIP